MAKQTRTTLKSFFQTGDVPTENNYADLVDSNLNLSENNTGDIQLTGEITASGNISSSGAIIASSFSADNTGGFRFESDNVRLLPDTTGDNLQIFGGGLDAQGNITASGNISSSGNLILDGEITASGDISASGTIFSSNFKADGLTAVRSVFSQNSDFTGSLFEDGNYKAISIGRSAEPTKNISLFGPITASGNISASGKLIASTLNTGQGDNELYDMNQNVTTTSAVTFATVNTGQGDNELYDMDQNVKTNSSVTFGSISIPTIDLSQVRTSEFAATFGDGSKDIGSAYGGIITITGVPSANPKEEILNFRVIAARCQTYMIIIANSDNKVLVNPNSIQAGAFFLNLSCGTEAFAGGTLKINFQMLGI